MGLGLTLLNLDTATARFMGNISSGRLCDVETWIRGVSTMAPG
jgi:hypothetical protein